MKTLTSLNCRGLSFFTFICLDPSTFTTKKYSSLNQKMNALDYNILDLIGLIPVAWDTLLFCHHWNRMSCKHRSSQGDMTLKNEDIPQFYKK